MSFPTSTTGPGAPSDGGFLCSMAVWRDAAVRDRLLDTGRRFPLDEEDDEPSTPPMEVPVITALIAALVSLALALGKIIRDAREKRHERRLAAREQLDRYRAPLLAAADELGRRLNNILNDNFFAYLGDNHKRELALSSTLYRFAQYFAWVEIVYGFSDRLRFASDQATVAVSRAIGDIAWTLAADEFDRKDPNNFTTSSLMLWREEQRAIGEMMRQDGVEAGCISFASFATTYEDRFSRWFTEFAADLEDPSSPASDRLAKPPPRDSPARPRARRRPDARRARQGGRTHQPTMGSCSGLRRAYSPHGSPRPQVGSSGRLDLLLP